MSEIIPSVKSSIKSFQSTVKSAKERQLEAEAQDAATVTADQTVGFRTIGPSTKSSVQRATEATRAANAGSSRRAGAGNTAEKGAKYTGKHSGALDKFMGDAKRVCSGLVLAADAHAKLTKAVDAGLAVDPSLVELAEQVLTNALVAATAILTSGKSLLAAVNEDIAAGQPDDEGDFETATGEVPPESGTSRALDSGTRAVMDYLGAVGSSHVATVDQATLLQIEQADWKKHALIRAVKDGDEAEAHRIGFGIPRPVSTDPVGDFMKTFSSN